MGARGPLPKPDKERRRRNAPSIPTTELPASGRNGRAPACPYKLGKAGRGWWTWAWKTPQACGWDDGSLFVVARRAQLEDDIVAIEHVGELADVVGLPRSEALRELERLFSRLKGLASGGITVRREMRELDDRLGLSPRGREMLRWRIVDDSDAKGAAPTAARSGARSKKDRLLAAVPDPPVEKAEG